MITTFQPRPISILATALVFGCTGTSLLATGIRNHVEKQIVGGTVFAILAVAALFYGLLWSWRFIREFLR